MTWNSGPEGTYPDKTLAATSKLIYTISRKEFPVYWCLFLQLEVDFPNQLGKNSHLCKVVRTWLQDQALQVVLAWANGIFDSAGTHPKVAEVKPVVACISAISVILVSKN